MVTAITERVITAIRAPESLYECIHRNATFAQQLWGASAELCVAEDLEESWLPSKDD